VPVELLDVDPRTLHLPWSRRGGADPAKFARQVSKYGRSLAGIPPIEVVRCRDGRLLILDGVTRATRVAKLLPGTPVTVLVTDERLNKDVVAFPTVGDHLP
jgi:hypothetical protein